MKKLSFIALVMLFSVSTVFALAFTPQKMTISSQSNVFYAFDGKALNIPVTIGGTPATVLFEVFTNGKASTVNMVKNGFLGWHFVNKIDTCLFTSSAYQFEKGAQSITWTGKDDDGNAVPKGTYTYYLWGYDSVSPKVAATRQMSFNWNETAIIRSVDDNGIALTQPEIYSGGRLVGNDAGSTVTHTKWAIGGDPNDASLVEYTTVPAFADLAPLALLSSDHTMYFKLCETSGTQIQLSKYKWIPNGASQAQTKWGNNGMFVFDFPEHSGEFHGSVNAPKNADYLITLNNNFFSSKNISELIYVDTADGTEIKRVDLSPWWVRVNEGGDAGGQYCGGPTDIWPAADGNVYLNFHGACLQHVINPNVDGDINDMTVWANANGDRIGDHNNEPSAKFPWICFDYNVAPYIYDSATDALGFSMIPTYDLGAVSFGLFAPDGTGIDYFSYANETAVIKTGNRVIDYNSAYDGIYTDNNSAATDTGGWFYIAHDSIKGTISNIVAVSDAAPAAFAVAQNSPNPFNPTTTISFTLAKAGKTTVDVYNVAGQKIDTLVNSSLSAGSHSVTWNASKFSAGVYFYTVKSGDFSKTTKMTLLK